MEIGQNTFNNCRDLEEINISYTSNLQIIGRNAFSGCSNLRSIYIPTNVNEIGDSAINRRRMEYRDGRILCDCAEERR